MRLVLISDLRDGATLGADVPGGAGRPALLRAGERMDGDGRRRLAEAGIGRVYVDDELGEGIEVPLPLSAEAREHAREALAGAFADAARMPGNLLCFERLEELVAAARLIVAEIETLPDAPYAFADLCGPAAYPVEHSIDATVVGLHVGRRLLPNPKLREQLGLGLFLQDIGTLALPPSIVHKPGELDEAESELMRRHPERGLAMLRDDSIGAQARSVVRSHHERWDGDGYPSGQIGEDTSWFARLAAVASAFDAVTSERHEAPAASQEAGLAALRAGAGSAFDPQLVEDFCAVVTPHPPGSEISLPDGRVGLVSAIVDDEPLVRLSGSEIPLAQVA
jgi:HD domain-containing protein